MCVCVRVFVCVCVCVYACAVHMWSSCVHTSHTPSCLSGYHLLSSRFLFSLSCPPPSLFISSPFPLITFSSLSLILPCFSFVLPPSLLPSLPPSSVYMSAWSTFSLFFFFASFSFTQTENHSSTTETHSLSFQRQTLPSLSRPHTPLHPRQSWHTHTHTHTHTV